MQQNSQQSAMNTNIVRSRTDNSGNSAQAIQKLNDAIAALRGQSTLISAQPFQQQFTYSAAVDTDYTNDDVSTVFENGDSPRAMHY